MGDNTTFWKYVVARARVSIWIEEGSAIIPATLIRLNRQRLFVDFFRSELERQNRFHFEERESGDKPAGALFGDDSVYEAASQFFAIEFRQGARVEEVVRH